MIVPLTDEDALQIAKRLKYLYVPKGKRVRTALQQTSKFYYIMSGKVVCSFPQQQFLQERAREEGIRLDETTVVMPMNADLAVVQRQMTKQISNLTSTMALSPDMIRIASSPFPRN